MNYLVCCLCRHELPEGVLQGDKCPRCGMACIIAIGYVVLPRRLQNRPEESDSNPATSAVQ